jgi:hypothetical protein
MVPYSAISIGWGWGRTMEKTWPRMPWDSAVTIEANHIHNIMQILGDGGSIYTLGPQGAMPYPKGPSGRTYPDKSPTAPVAPPSRIIDNYIHDAHPAGPDAPGAGSHFPGGIYNDEGSTNWVVSGILLVVVLNDAR